MDINSIGSNSDIQRNKPAKRIANAPEHLLKISIEINGRAEDYIVDELLTLKTDYNNWTDGDLAQALERCSIWRFTFLSAAEQKLRELRIEEEKLADFYAEACEKAEEALIERKMKDKKERGVPVSIMSSISKLERENYIRSQPDLTHDWFGLKNKVRELESQHKKLMELRDCMQQRANDIRPLINFRLEQRRMENYIKTIKTQD